MLMIAQAPIIAILICLIFNKIGPSVPFLMAISASWFGTNNAAREIVGEASIYKRERMFNQGIFPYIFSKLMVLSTFSLVQSVVFVTIIAIRYSSSDPSWHQAGLSIGWMFMLSVTASLLGLLLSATAKSTEKVMSLVPIALIPQIMLAGALTPIKSNLIEFISYFTIARWGNEGFSNIQKEVVMTYAPPTIKGAEVPQVISKDVIVDAIPELMKNDKHQLGWIAQELEEISPNSVSTTSMYRIDDCKHIETIQIQSFMYGTIQKLMNITEQQQIIIEQLQQRIQVLESK
jgi:hypothetical protein